MSRLVLVQHSDTVATITLDRPERHNSLVPELLEQMLDALATFRRDQTICAIVVQANGRSFSTGGDVRTLYEHLDDIEGYASEIVGLLNEVILALLDLPAPVVTAVQGIVTGGSLGIVLASDIVLMAPEATVTPYYSVVGFSPDGGWTALLPQIIGIKRTSEILMRNLTITAEQAVAWGLANRVVAVEQLRDEAHAVANSIAEEMQPGSIGHAKMLLRRHYTEAAARLDDERSHFLAQIVTDEARRGMAAFLGEAEPGNEGA